MLKVFRRLLLSFFLFLFVLGAVNAQSNELVICWDISTSMEDRVVEVEFAELEKIFEKRPNTAVKLHLFGVEVETKAFLIRQGNWTELKNTLSTVVHDGGTVFSALNPLIENKAVLLFTDGNQLLTKDYLSLGEGSIIFNSSPFGNKRFLKRTALINRSEYKDLAPAVQLERGEEGDNQVTATVFYDNERLPNIPIQVKGSGEVSYTDARGQFVISAADSDSIVINNSSEYTFALKDILGKDLFLESRITQLDEVVLTESRRKVATTDLEAKEGQGYASQSIGDKELTSVNTNLNSAVTGRFSGVTTASGIQSGGDKDLSKFTVRGQSSILLNNYGLIVVDGVPIKQSNSANNAFQTGDAVASTNFLDPSLIEDITVLKGLAATNRFGSLGSNGVLLITTKAAVARGKDGEVVDRARLKDNVYDQNESLNDPQSAPFYKALKATQSIEEAYLNYTSLRELNKKNIPFYLEAYDFFKNKDKALSVRVLSNLLELNPQDIRLLRTLEFYFSGLGNTVLAEKLNNQILEIDADNLHANYRKVMLPSQQSLQSQLRAQYGLLKAHKAFRQVNAKPLEKTLRRDITNFINKNRNSLNLGGISPELANELRYDARFVFEWNNPEVEFELQFVNPQNRFYNWQYSRDEDPDRINTAIANSYMLEEFEFYGKESKGTWIVNVKFLGNISQADNTPFVLKGMVYTNFGKPNEQKKAVVVHLSKPNQKQNVFQLTVQ